MVPIDRLAVWVVMISILDRCWAIHVSLRAPRYVMMGGSATLNCDYDVHEDQIHKVEWLRGENKIYQFVKGRNPPYRNFSISGADIDWTDTNDKRVSLKNLQFEASGVYTCEVSTNHPIYTKPSDEEYLTVMQSQMHDPHITFNQANFTVGDTLDANCTSSPATPVPELTWLLNGKKADESWIRSFPEVKQSSSMVQLTMTVSSENAPQLRVTCLSTIPGYLGHHVQDTEYADYRSHTINVDVAVPPTEAAQTAGTDATMRCRWQISVLLFLGMFTLTSL
ncbi:uncharacterized protein LOC135848027 [Planococcus citri]|uniref:uncharacterized protein LOC135848027 n=1 Tax=Planococcus citri TaxID=170843 RepID=UPI0031FA11E8